MTSTAALQPETSAQPRYEILDGLRGVAAVLVILYHFGEGFATSAVDQMMTHGYLAVDFFFVLSGFVIGYAYDRCWKNKGMTTGRFMLRRIIRLQPMVVLSVIIGAIASGKCTLGWHAGAVPLGIGGIDSRTVHDTGTSRGCGRCERQRRDVSPQRSGMVSVF